MKREIKVGMLVSYDYECIKNSLPPVYDYADRIVLAVDKDGKTWSGNDITIDASFWQWIKEFDTQHKIEIYRDTFYVEGLSSVQNDTRERNMLGKYMGEGGWHVQIDADEYFVDFKDFVDFLHYLDVHKKHINCVYQEWLLLYKRLSNGYLFVKGGGGSTAIATKTPNYVCCRIVENEKKIVYPQRVIHESFARTEEALYTKLKNWSHNTDFDTEGYFHYWKMIDERNYMFISNLHPIWPEVWRSLAYIKADSISELTGLFKSPDNKELLSVPKRKCFIIRMINLFTAPILKEIKNYKLLKSFNIK